MTGTRVPFFARCRQIPLTLIAMFSCALSFWLTVRFCGQLSPGHASLEILAIGFVWEMSKLVFGTSGAHRLAHGGTDQRRLGYALVAMSLVLAVGSVVASLAFLRQTDHRLSEQAVQASNAYQRRAANVAAMDREIDTLAAVASQDAATQMYRARSLRTLDRVAALRTERTQAVQEMMRLEASGSPGERSKAGSAPLALGGWVSAEAMRGCAQCVLAVVLELVSVMAMGLLVTREDDTQPSAGPRPLYLVRSSAKSQPPQRACSASAEMDGYARAKALVGSARLKPSYRAMRKALDISQPTALRFLRIMAAEGILRREGRSYALAHGVVVGGAA